jgi:hypothetical protein
LKKTLENDMAYVSAKYGLRKTSFYHFAYIFISLRCRNALNYHDVLQKISVKEAILEL